ncbi:hypothetical protein [Synechococcus elongatus]|uniref:Uncharacterized protein n=2 Tax=Synechococcus elongatus TaxID=32046 RepID=Q31K72_SYNE7|nr:hypothetical protein [Synechococcus elongatus]ABB58547.1 conserved hypothetical protein [Synechococcus elongatus PCC 7942 = FACHB-805]AJD57000.1 hypothetical protein M744_03635 [Synechococcus elongatus UTEX 2973]MBD2587266.1 hypothetical protein [Synechococcus elongatus FACHB-242]MBD2688335.1 hypothetical protein [Synechococcus elongatus FACHB-1061]MBD2705953.1 hypothetical protein [Synechococcus elongatus PCC 7942 = FACHB-805]
MGFWQRLQGSWRASQVAVWSRLNRWSRQQLVALQAAEAAIGSDRPELDRRLQGRDWLGLVGAGLAIAIAVWLSQQPLSWPKLQVRLPEPVVTPVEPQPAPDLLPPPKALPVTPPPAPKPAPEPPRPSRPTEIDPNARLIEAIQSEVSAISDRYSEALILGVEANFVGSRLRLRLSDGWGSLAASQQDQLAQEVFQQVRELGFRRLEIVDERDRLLARSPVIGAEMLIVSRES